MDSGDLLTRWTIRLALALYLLAVILRATTRRHPARLVWARLAWTGGYVAFLLHVACAFHFYHHWSHDAAYEATARQTEVATGLAWGGGLYANYVFALLWGVDVCWWWRSPKSYQGRPWSIEWVAQGYFAFIAFNATVVFGVGTIRWLGLAACLLLAVVFAYTEGHRDKP